MTFLALVKQWCTTKSFCLMWSHFEKWHDPVVCGVISCEHKYNTKHCALFFSRIFLLDRWKQMQRVVLGYRWNGWWHFHHHCSNHLLTLPLRITCKFLWVCGDVSQKWIGPAPLLNTRRKDLLFAGWPDSLAMSASGQHTYYFFSWCVAFVASSRLQLHSWTALYRLPHQRDSNHVRRVLYMNHRDCFTECISSHRQSYSNTTGFQRHRPSEVTLISLLGSTRASVLPSMGENYSNMEWTPPPPLLFFL